MKLSIVAAIGKGHELGRDNQLLWHIKADLQNFKRITLGHHMLMGRKTYDSIGKPLPQRTSLVLSRGDLTLPTGALQVRSIDEAIAYARGKGEEELMVIGGGDVYEQTIGRCQRLYLTQVDYSGPADTYFPQIDLDVFSCIEEQVAAPTANTPGWKFQLLERKELPGQALTNLA